MKGIIPLFLFICYFNVCYPQSPRVISGMVFNARSGIRMGGILIRNTRSSVLTRSNDHGEFKVVVSIGDTLSIIAEGYATDRSIVEDFKDKIIKLEPSGTLAEVVVRATPLSNELADVANSYRGKGVFYQGKPPLALLSPFGGSPLTFLYEMTSRDAKNARRFNTYSSKLEEEHEINRRFNDKVIMSLLAIPAADIHKFKEMFKPTIAQVMEWNDVELFDYIKKSYQTFKDK